MPEPEVLTGEVVEAEAGRAVVHVPVPKAVTDAEALMAGVDGLTIQDDASLAAAVELASSLDDAAKKGEAARTFLVKPLNDHVKAINGVIKPRNDALIAAVRALKAKIGAYHVQRERAEQDAARNAAEFLGQSEEVQRIVGSKTTKEVARTAAATATTADVWDYEVVDLKAMCAAIGAGRLEAAYVEPARGKIRSSMNELAGIGVLKDGEVVYGIRYHKRKDVRLS